MGGKFENDRYDNYISAISFGRTLGQSNGKPQSSIVDAHFDSNGVMGGIAKQFSNAELKAMAAYIGSLEGDMKVVPQSKFR
eukprot:gene13631-15681_t